MNAPRRISQSDGHRFLLQRKGDGMWSDAESFVTEEDAVRALRWARQQEAHRIAGLGGENWSGQRVPTMRIVRVVQP